MMTFLRRLKQYRVYRRMVLSYLLLSVITITLLSATLYAMFSARAVREIDQSSREMLTQVSYTSNVVYEQVQRITGQLLSDQEMISFLYAKEDDKIVNYTASLFLARIQGIYPFIKNISIYNLTTGAYIDTLGLVPDPDVAKKDALSDFGFFPRTMTSLGGTTFRLLTYMFIPERSFTDMPKSAIVVDLDESYIRNTMRAISGSSRDSLTFVMDKSGKVLSHTNPIHFMEDFSSTDYVQRLLASDRSEGSFIARLDGQKQRVTYVKSAAPDWYFISVRPYSEIISNITELRNWTIAIVALLLVAAAAGSLLLSRNIYNPMKALLDKVGATEDAGTPSMLRLDEYKLLADAFSQSLETTKTMATSLNRSQRALQDSYLSHLLRGNASKIEVSAEMKREWEQRLGGPFLTVILIKIDGYKAFRERNNAFDRGLFRYAICNIAQEILGQSFDVHIDNEEDEIALIVQSESDTTGDKLDLLLGEVQETVLKYCRISLSIGIGDPSASLGGISDSYQSAQRYLNDRLFLGGGSVISAATKRRVSDTDSEARYPVSLEKRIIEAIKLCRRADLRKEISAFRTFLEGCTHASAMQCANFLVYGIVREFEYISGWWSMDSALLQRSIDEVPGAETLDDIERILSGLCQTLVGMLEENKKNLSVTRNAEIVEDIQRYVREHYAEHGMSLEAAAEHVGFSSGYIGKLFKSMTGASFNDYVTHIRLEQAKLLLSTTGDSVAQIGEKVGVYNVPYFTTLFKKKYGITPTQYREQSSEGASSAG